MFLFVPQTGVTDASLHSDLSLKTITSTLFGDVMPSVVATQALNKELCFQWYIPPLVKPPKETEPMVCNIITKLSLKFECKV